MSGSSQLLAKLVHIHVEQAESGLFIATSADLRGLVVGARTLDELNRAIPKAITEMYAACDLDVVVTKVDDATTPSADGLTPWVAFPAELARNAISAR